MGVMDIFGDGWKVMYGSCLDRLPELADESVDAVVCDPPYELGFMGKSWDSSGIAYDVNVWRECLRVLKPGGHLLAFGGSRTWHRIAVAIEDAGFEVRDSIAWLYGSGFPKSLDVSKAIDKAAGVEREVVTETVVDIFGEREQDKKKLDIASTRDRIAMGNGWRGEVIESVATSDDAKKWQGWGTALKPAFEPVVVARKPFIGTVAANVLAYGTGGLNIDGTRIQANDQEQFEKNWNRNQSTSKNGVASYVAQSGVKLNEYKPNGGRWPSNVMLDEYTAGLVDQQSGITKSGDIKPHKNNHSRNVDFNNGIDYVTSTHKGDSGGASRFFYVAKASKRDRNEGLDELPIRRADERTETGMGTFAEKGVQPAQNFHPTVKPTDLMRQLIRLVTPPGGVVLDPFTGSGSTGKAAMLEGMQFIGCELTEDYLPIIQGRIDWAVEQVKTDRVKSEQDEAEKLF